MYDKQIYAPFNREILKRACGNASTIRDLRYRKLQKLQGFLSPRCKGI